MAAQADILVVERSLSSSAKQQHQPSASAEDEDFVIGTAVVAVVEDDNDDAEQCCVQAFDASLVALGLSELGLSSCGTQQVYQRLEVRHTDLQDPQAITHCRHVQQLVLAGNRLTTLQPLGQLKHLTSLDVSHNRLTAALDYRITTDTTGTCSSRTRAGGQRSTSSNLRKADLSYNSIDTIGSSLSHHSNLQELLLAGNRLQRISSGLGPLTQLRRLDLCSNSLRTCEGLQGLCSLQELSLDGNSISKLQPLSGLSSLQVLSIAHNQIACLDGIESLASLRALDVGGNQLRRVEALAACRGLSLMSSLNIAGNPVEAAQNVRHHVVHLLTQLRQLNGVDVTVVEKVDAGNMVGAAADGLVLIRRQFFQHGELEDGGGAVPPTAAGLKASRAEEERSCTDTASMFSAINTWARSVRPSLALAPAVSAPSTTGFTAAGRASSLAGRVSSAGLPLAAHQSAASAYGAHTQVEKAERSSASSRRVSSSSRSSSAGTRPGSIEGGGRLSASLWQQYGTEPPAQPCGITAIAARLAAGCCPEAPFRQLQLLRACYCWVLTHVQLPKDCHLEAGPEAVTCDVGRHVFGEQDKQVLLHQVLLPETTGTWSECVSQLLVNLLRACHMEAQQLSGFWKAGGLSSVGPGEQLASHNHSWVAAKVNGCWRLLDPVYALIMAARDQQLPFYLPPEAFIATHLPFEPCWQLLPEPVRAAEWWERPGLSLGFAAAGGRLLDGGALQACTVIELDREALLLPTVKIPIAAPTNGPGQQHLRISLLDSNRRLLASWQQPGSPQRGSMTQHATLPDDSKLEGQLQSTPGSEDAAGATVDGCLVFQQHMLGSAGGLRVQLGSEEAVHLEVQELWAAVPGPGTFFVKVEQVREVAGGLMPAVRIAGLQQPLSLTLRQSQDVLQLKVVVKPAAAVREEPTRTQECNSSSSLLPSLRPPVVAYLPHPIAPASAEAAGAAGTDVRVQLLSPQPGALLEADRTQHFEVVAPAGAAVAGGSEQSGWVVLQQQQQQPAEQQASSAATSAGAGDDDLWVLSAGSMVLPRISTCYVAVQGVAGQQQQQGHAWVPVLSLPVRPPVQELVVSAAQALHDSAGDVHSSSGSPHNPLHNTAAHLLSALDVGGDGAVSRKDMLLAFRRDRQLADHLKMPARIRAGPDGTFDAFLSKFVAINRSGLGLVGVEELAAYLASLAAAATASRSGTSADSSRVATAASRSLAAGKSLKKSSGRTLG